MTKADFNAKFSGCNRKITQNKTKHLLVENELNKLKTFDSCYFIGKSHFEEDGTQNYLVFHPLFRYYFENAGTVKPVYNDHLGDEVSMVVIGRWSL